MPILSGTFYWAICDECGKPALEDEVNEERADLYDTQSAIEEVLDDMGMSQDGRVLCFACLESETQSTG